MPPTRDGPSSPHFSALPLAGNTSLADLPSLGISKTLAEALQYAPGGSCVAWGIPFEVDSIVALRDAPVDVALPPTRAQWLVFLHTSDIDAPEPGPGGFISPMRGEGRLGEQAATYTILYADGSEQRLPILRRHQIGSLRHRWGERCFQAVDHHKPYPVPAGDKQDWGWSQTRVSAGASGAWISWLWAWENPRPDEPLRGVRFEPVSGTVLILGMAAGQASSLPLRWRARRKAVLRLPAGQSFARELDRHGLLAQIQLDLGQVISAEPRPLYPQESWSESANNQLPEVSETEVLLEYSAHPDACFHLDDGSVIPVREVEAQEEANPQESPASERSASERSASEPPFLSPVRQSRQRVLLRVVERGSRQPVPVKLHVHGEHGEYLAPLDRHRILNPAWFEDYSVDFSHRGRHACTYINGETDLLLPLGKIYLEISKGFEIRPLRSVVEVTPETETIEIEIEKVLPWRERGWVTADTHVHFLSPVSARLEGAAEGVNVINLLASQWGELMTNVGDFDGQTTWGSKEAGGEGEYLVRVGSENRQHVMGHISLLGYRGRLITPMTTGGPDESAIGDPIDVLLTEWARQCHQQGGLVVLPHFPNPRAEHAASIVAGDIDALEMTSWGDLYSGIDPYSLADWYRYLNCGYPIPAVGGTDKMTAQTAVGTVRTYARLDPQRAFDYDGWMEAVRRKETFVTYGPLLEFSVAGHTMGSRMQLSPKGGRLDVAWQVASVTMPVRRVELVINGEIRESRSIAAGGAAKGESGSWTVPVERSSWLALLVRGGYPDIPEFIAAHSSPVFVEVEGSPLFAAADAVTILEQIEGALAFLDTVGTRAEDKAYKRMRLVIESAHRSLHNRMHRNGLFHQHNPVEEHK